MLGQHLAAAAGADRTERATTWWTSALRFLGCTGHAFDMAVVFGDEIEMRAESLQADFANPFDMLRLMVTHAGPGTSGVRRMRSVLAVLAGGKKAAEMNFRSACEVADVFAKRLDLDEAVRAALAASFERWNGRGLPAGRKGTQIPLPMRIAQLGQELEVLARIEGIDRALAIVKRRRGKAYDPELTDLVLAEAEGWWDDVEPLDPWDAALARRAGRHAARRARTARGAARAGRLLRPEVAVARRSLPGRRRARGRRVRTGGRSRRAGARPRPCGRSRTPSGTSRRRSRATSATAPSSTRWSPTSSSAACRSRRRLAAIASAGTRAHATAPATTAGSARPSSTTPSGCSPRPTATRP